ncbi:FAD-dependent oxidoreductase [Nonomuraea soli]|uniref:FAD-dependent urate hydroxylase n=1 Tax=Nonomuraea soli TaxID=1032476 RepID=A0A7W0HS13_9ACTN|nr:NAD(P)/FAD-dependent oxidoreductase [Nonomuraea soli]MBA2893588.1 FAD-dependent urate hydroxylase [Nonomuraea soli]
MGIKTKRVVVIGAGVAGLATARALRSEGHHVEVFEEAPEPRATGGSISIWPGASTILERLGVDPGRKGSRLREMQTLSPRGPRRAGVDLAVAERRLGAPSWHIARQDLVELLAEDVEVTYGATIASADPDRAQVRLADGTTVGGDVLVGADGRRSVVRRALRDEDPARPSGWVTWQGYLQGEPRWRFLDGVAGPKVRGRLGEGVQHTVTMMVGRAGLFGLAPAGSGRLLWWFDVRSRPGRRLWTDETDPMPALKGLFGGWADPVSTLLGLVSAPPSFAHVKHRVPKVWGRGPTTLAGDAAHSMPPAMAMGANQALEDAWALARGIGDLRRYERERTKVVRLPALMAGLEMSNYPAPPMPDAVMSSVFTTFLRRSSTYLLTTSR